MTGTAYFMIDAAMDWSSGQGGQDASFFCGAGADPRRADPDHRAGCGPYTECAPYGAG